MQLLLLSHLKCSDDVIVSLAEVAYSLRAAGVVAVVAAVAALR